NWPGICAGRACHERCRRVRGHDLCRDPGRRRPRPGIFGAGHPARRPGRGSARASSHARARASTHARARSQPYVPEAGDVMSRSPEPTPGRADAQAPDAGRQPLSPTRTLAVDPLLEDPGTRIVVCCGSRGGGETPTAAALRLRAPERGRRVVVLPNDPARRIAQSMGIDSLDNPPRQVKGIDDSAGGELHAMMLDMKRTFDEIVEAHADPERAAAILGNPFYQSLSAGFAGTQEYMAMEKLGQLRSRDEWDLIIVDTPPSRSALDFLDAPKRLGSFLDGRLIRVLLAPAKVGGRAGMKFLNV